MTITQDQAVSLFSSPILAGRVAEEIDAQAAEALADLDAVIAGFAELRERLSAGTLDVDVRHELGDDLVDVLDGVMSFALAVAA